MKLADRILTVSKETKKYVLRLGADPKITLVMYNGVDTTCFRSGQKMESRIKLSLPMKQKIVFSVRRLVYKNGLDTLIESAALIIKNNPNVLFVIAGKGPSRKLIEVKIKELGVENNIILTGFVPDELLPLYYNASDYFVLPSASGEGLPLVLFEAMACGLPVVATKVGGTPEIINHMENGVLVAPTKPKEMAMGLANLLDNEDLAIKIGENAKVTIQNRFSWTENVRQLKEVYNQFI